MVKLDKFAIEFSNIEGAYFAGQEVSGKVSVFRFILPAFEKCYGQSRVHSGFSLGGLRLAAALRGSIGTSMM